MMPMPPRHVWVAGCVTVGFIIGSSLTIPSMTWAIVAAPTQDQVDAAVQKGRDFAPQGLAPDRLFEWFGPDEDLKPRGFVLSKMVGLRVMAAHFALRSAPLTDDDIRQVVSSPSMTITTFIFGDQPNFAVNTYVVMDQGGKAVKPANVRFDAAAARSKSWPRSPAYRAKIVATFNYADIDPMAASTLRIYPPHGGEVTFELDFSHID